VTRESLDPFLMRYLLLCIVIASCGRLTQVSDPTALTVQQLQTGSTASLRGVSVVGERVVWASGTGGNVLRTTDGGATWQLRKVRDADSLDLRDIEAFDSLNAYVLSAGEDGRIYFTSDGGATWALQFRNEVKGAFFDCFDFYDRRSGIAMSDPVAGRYLLISTSDGQKWHELPALTRPPSMQGEAAFAASGTCLTIIGNRIFLASGGGTHARVFWSDDRGQTWHATSTPVAAGAPSAGIFALAFRDEKNGIAIGGDYQKPQQEAVVAVTNDRGVTWRSAGRTAYTSGAAWSRSGATLIAVGTIGTRVSRDGGHTWTSVDSLEYNAVQFANERVAFAVGPRGRISRIERR
jgi:photosystem II stability/assembly factor-like uncharacterized protein